MKIASTEGIQKSFVTDTLDTIEKKNRTII